MRACVFYFIYFTLLCCINVAFIAINVTFIPINAALIAFVLFHPLPLVALVVEHLPSVVIPREFEPDMHERGVQDALVKEQPRGEEGTRKLRRVIHMAICRQPPDVRGGGTTANSCVQRPASVPAPAFPRYLYALSVKRSQGLQEVLHESVNVIHSPRGRGVVDALFLCRL